ncbi:hypothetical protein [Crossiella sp. CA198]|uniref:hypothetical protein n=1 Tax=Crossiella sp. CA198 TaxID=3455607 RepID=UPI003F8D2703
MSGNRTPSRIALHMRVPRGWARVAEYRLLTDGSVALLNQPSLSYYRFTDESDTPEASAP